MTSRSCQELHPTLAPGSKCPTCGSPAGADDVDARVVRALGPKDWVDILRERMAGYPAGHLVDAIIEYGDDPESRFRSELLGAAREMYDDDKRREKELLSGLTRAFAATDRMEAEEHAIKVRDWVTHVVQRRIFWRTAMSRWLDLQPQPIRIVRERLVPSEDMTVDVVPVAWPTKDDDHG